MTIQELYDLAKENGWLNMKICVNDECGFWGYAKNAYVIDNRSENAVMID